MPSDCQGFATLGTNYCVKQPKYQNLKENLDIKIDSKLGMCSGDCDNDNDCEGNLLCMHRDAFSGQIIDKYIDCSECSKHTDLIFCDEIEDRPGLCRAKWWENITRATSGPNSCAGEVSFYMNIKKSIHKFSVI